MTLPLVLPPQTFTARYGPSKETLEAAFVGKPLRELRTPALIIDRAVFAENCTSLLKKTNDWNWKFRAHIKTHKATEGVRLQLNSGGIKANSIVVSTLLEAHSVVDNGLVDDGTVGDILYGVPVGANKLADLADLDSRMRTYGGRMRIMVDNPDQILALEAFNNEKGISHPWSAFFKVDLGDTKRAGLVPFTEQFAGLLRMLVKSLAVELFGFYCHAGTSYASKSLEDASGYLTAEISAVLDAADIARPLLRERAQSSLLVLSVGATPTAHAFSKEAIAALQSRLNGAGAELELHAGNYSMLDLQQLATGLISREAIAQRVLASVVSYYPKRGVDGTDEAMCDAGGIALTKDTGPVPGYGEVVRIIKNTSPSVDQSYVGLGRGPSGWIIGRTSQEHGILTRLTGDDGRAIASGSQLRVGDMVEIIGQHACYIAAAYPWYYIIDSSLEEESEFGGNQRVVEIWVPYKGW